MTSVKGMLTYQDYVALPDDGRRYEILDGELFVSAAPNRTHQYVLLELAVTLHGHVRAGSLGEVYVAPFDVILAETTIAQPDIIFVARDRMAIFSDRGADGAPTLVIEILSPSTGHVDRGRKLELYGRYGVPYSWIVDSDLHVIDVYRLVSGTYGAAQRFEGDGRVSVPPFDELSLDLGALWRR